MSNIKSNLSVKQALQTLKKLAKKLGTNLVPSSQVTQASVSQLIQAINSLKTTAAPRSAPSVQSITNAINSAPGLANLPAPPKLFHTRPGKPRNIKTISSVQTMSQNTSVAKYKAFLNRALSGIDRKDEIDTAVLREKLGLSQEEKEQSKNLYLMENLNDTEKYQLFRSMKERLSIYFNGFKPMRISPSAYGASYSIKHDVCYHTAAAYSHISESNFDIEIDQITERKVIDSCLLISEHPRLTNMEAQGEPNAAEMISKIDPDGSHICDAGRGDHVESVLKKVGSKILKELYNNAGDIEKKVEVMEAIEHYKNQGKIVSVLEESQKAYADVFKLSDKYSIRIGDGERFVASDNVKITFRDPSENPSWAIWFLDAVPLSKVPDRTSMLFLPKDQWEKQYPEPLENHPIVCHASLWQLPENQSGVLLHTAWHNLAVAYRWYIDKPLDVARIMFKAVSHPAHIARNFGYAPQIREPGEAWF